MGSFMDRGADGPEPGRYQYVSTRKEPERWPSASGSKAGSEGRPTDIRRATLFQGSPLPAAGGPGRSTNPAANVESIGNLDVTKRSADSSRLRGSQPNRVTYVMDAEGVSSQEAHGVSGLDATQPSAYQREPSFAAPEVGPPRGFGGATQAIPPQGFGGATQAIPQGFAGVRMSDSTRPRWHGPAGNGQALPVGARPTAPPRESKRSSAQIWIMIALVLTVTLAAVAVIASQLSH